MTSIQVDSNRPTTGAARYIVCHLKNTASFSVNNLEELVLHGKMGKNYYDVLGIPKTADEAEIKKAYKKAALKYHPDRPGGDKVKFQEVSEAFEVLSDSKKKQLYDQFGEAGLGMGGAEPGDADGAAGNAGPFPGGMGGHTFSFRTTRSGSDGFHGRDPFSIFESFFGTMDVDQAEGSEGGEMSYDFCVA